MALAVLERAAKSILRLADPNLRRSHARALKDSLEVRPGDDPENLPTAKGISDYFSIDLPTLVETLICLDRESAVAFLHDMSKPMTLATFSKRYTAKKHKELLGRPPTVLGKKHVYTYGEVLHLIEYAQHLTFPPSLNRYLR